ncbi:probable LRR receptor-like serine/threonine-protein kinase At4g37250 [Chenopodium quinoa]|uniref:probable LRR receptor-like serine/threonine-protein kinase At4g37250 n=1 Tax=Chenopodium quinoa TaxID=63459 RepID=UPI000B79024D|nr:probable LRR receptor-like serine/threonine-protein kinase At4g37250 [Chenopodium quinoa]
MSKSALNTFSSLLFAIILSLQLDQLISLNTDGTFLLSLKYSILNDPLSVLDSWDYLDETPCTWSGVVCTPDQRVITLALPNSQLLGSIPSDLGLIEHLQHLDLYNNSFNGTLPPTLFNSSELQLLSLSSNEISGGIPVFSHSSLSFLNLSNNAFGGPLPVNFTSGFNNLTVLSLKGNYFSGNVPSGFPPSIEILDLSSNLFNGTLPADLGVGSTLRYLNLSYNKISGEIPAEFAGDVPRNATIDVSYNNLTGQVPGLKPFMGQNPEFFSGNQELCGKPLKNLCVIPSTLSTPPNVSASISPAIAVIPKPVDNSNSNSDSDSNSGGHNNGLKPAAIVGITVADLAGVGILGVVFFYLYQLRNKRVKQQQSPEKDFNNISSSNNNLPPRKKAPTTLGNDHFLVQINNSATTTVVPNNKLHKKCFTYCIKGDQSEEGATTDTRTSSESENDGSDDDNDDLKNGEKPSDGSGGGSGGGGSLMMVDGETELEAETLLKASAYILGASGSSIVYKAVLQDGTTFAVRRLGEIAVDKLRDFEGHIKAIAKIRHPNLVRVRGFYWASDEKLVIYDYISNGSLATSAYKKSGSTPYHLPLEARLRIARGLARGLNYIHDKRYVHANIKPSNILLTQDMEPIISDLGLSWLVYGINKGSGSARQFGSKRSMGSYDGTQDLSVSGSPYINPFGNTNGVGSPYHAPESLKNLKPNPKWDVYSFGIVLLELLTGKVYLDRELGQWTPSSGLEDRYWVLRIADVALRAEIQGKEDAMMSIFKLGFSCASLVPQKRPSMKEALQVLEKVSLSFVH